MKETRQYLDSLEDEGVIKRRGYVVMLANETRSPNRAVTRQR